MRVVISATIELVQWKWKSNHCWGVGLRRTRTFILSLITVMGRLKKNTIIRQVSLSLSHSHSLCLSCSLKSILKERAQIRQLENTCKLLIVVNHLRADRCMIQQTALKNVEIRQHRCQEKSSPKSQAPVWVRARG